MNIGKEVDVLVIGAGPSGTIAASIIKQSGLTVEIVEKMQFPRFVIGESLLPRCMEALEEAKFLDAVKAKGFQQKDGAKFVMNGRVCDFTFSQQHTKGWGWTWQVPRADFDKTLADECEKMGIPVHYQTEVTNIEIFDDHSITTIKTADGATQTIRAKFIVDGSGYGRVIPRLFGLEKPSHLKQRKTLFCHMTDPKRHTVFEPNRITAIVHNPDTWIWVIPFSNGLTSVGYVGEPEFFEQFTGTPEEQFRALLNAQPELAERFDESEMAWEPRTLQSWSATTETFYGKGFVLTGNVTEFLDPIFSSGVTLAAVSAQLAAKLVIKQLNGENVDWEASYMQPMMQGIDVFRTYVNRWYDGTLYKIFFSEGKQEQIIGQICSVLAGYVWDETNPFVINREKNLPTLARFLETMNKTTT
ncbi:MAG: FAD-dependent oxidoreductase [Chitinophagaceae bacterium]|nr:FAD-dependent oxidoreductase [Chitinophagaceae bacterium]MCB9047731.1 FAD-dependent oxidoreductase [Chitinophagales bacterium]